MANGYISFGSNDVEIAKHLPEYKVEDINKAFNEIIAENMEMDEYLEIDEDFFEGF